MKNEKLIKLATSVIKKKKIGNNTIGDVGCAVLSEKGKVHLGICVDTIAGMGFCAEHNAIGQMVTSGEYRFKKIVAVWKDKNGKAHVLHPCGRCREFMRQMSKRNMESEIILGLDKVVKLKELLPYNGDFHKVYDFNAKCAKLGYILNFHEWT